MPCSSLTATFEFEPGHPDLSVALNPRTPIPQKHTMALSHMKPEQTCVSSGWAGNVSSCWPSRLRFGVKIRRSGVCRGAAKKFLPLDELSLGSSLRDHLSLEMVREDGLGIPTVAEEESNDCVTEIQKCIKIKIVVMVA